MSKETEEFFKDRHPTRVNYSLSFSETCTMMEIYAQSKLKAVDRQKLIDFSIWDCRMDKDITLDNITKDVDSYLNELKKQ